MEQRYVVPSYLLIYIVGSKINIAHLSEYTIRILYNIQLTVLNAGRLYMDTDDLSGKVFVTSGLGGMSGAQAKVQEYLNRV